MIKKIRHVGIVLDNLERALEKFEGFGLPCTERREDKEIGIKAGFLPVGDTSLEIIDLKTRVSDLMPNLFILPPLRARKSQILQTFFESPFQIIQDDADMPDFLDHRIVSSFSINIIPFRIH